MVLLDLPPLNSGLQCRKTRVLAGCERVAGFEVRSKDILESIKVPEVQSNAVVCYRLLDCKVVKRVRAG